MTAVAPEKSNMPNYSKGGGTYPNLFDAHPPFQIDGNFGGTARGGFEVNFKWKDGKVRDCSIKAKTNSTVTLLYNGQQKTVKLKAGKTQNIKTW